MGARDGGLCPCGLKVSASISGDSGGEACLAVRVLVRVQDTRVGVTECVCFLESAGQRVWGVEASHRFLP